MMTRTAGLAGQQQARPDQMVACTWISDSAVWRGVCVAADECLTPIWVGLPGCTTFNLML
jgi:hypothetical protein